MNEQTANPRSRGTIKSLALVLGALVMLTAGLLLFAITRPPEAPFDDSAMMPERPRVADQDNGYPVLTAALAVRPGQSQDNKDLFAAWEQTPPDPALIQKLKSKYGDRSRQISRALDYPRIIAPAAKPAAPRTHNKHYSLLIARDTARYALILARYEVAAGNQDRALEHLRFAMRLGHALQSAYGGLEFLVIGDSIQSLTRQEIRVLLDGNKLSTTALARLARDMQTNQPRPDYWELAVQVEYEATRGLAVDELQRQARDPHAPPLRRFAARGLLRPNAVNRMRFDHYSDLAMIIRNSAAGTSPTAAETCCKKGRSVFFIISTYLRPGAVPWGVGDFCTPVPNVKKAGLQYREDIMAWHRQEASVARRAREL